MERGVIALILLFCLCGCIDSGMDKEYGGKAVEFKDSSLCEKIQDDFRKDVCFSQVCEITQDFSVCEKINDQHLRDIYYSNYAGYQMDAGKCEKISDISLKKYCIDYVSKKKQAGI